MPAHPDQPPPPRARAIPLRAHFVWFGRELPWVTVLAVRSAAERGGFREVILHHDDDLSGAPHYRALREIDRLALRPLDTDALWRRCEPFAATHLDSIYRRLPTLSIRKDLVRYALLYQEGGVGLDLDTVTVASLAGLCAGAEAFCGEERIVFPARVRHSRHLGVRSLAHLRNGVRDLLGAVPYGWALFRRIERLYPCGENVAVLGSAPGGRFITRVLERIIDMPAETQTRSCGIGPHLLQELSREVPAPYLVVHPPPVFYPLGPEVSRHWFHLGRGTAPLARVLFPETRIVHWYGSVGNQKLTERIDPAYVKANASRQLFSQLALPFAGA